MDVFDVISLISKSNPNIAKFRLFEFAPSPSLQERVQSLSPQDEDLLEIAFDLRARRGVSFWDALVSAISESELEAHELMQARVFHQPNAALDDVHVANLSEYVRLSRRRNIAMNSSVVLSGGGEAHLVALDFKVSFSPQSLMGVIGCVKALGLRGWVLNSGKSFHFWGADLITQPELIKILAKFVLLHPISDKSWAAHQIFEGSASLRISSRYGHFPVVVASVLGSS